MTFRILMGAAAGVLLGGLIGYFGKSRGGSCPILCNPIGGAIWGALVGGLLASFFSGGSALYGDETVRKIESPEQFQRSVLEAETPVMVKFYSDTCPPCRVLAPRYAQLAEDYQGRVSFVAVNVKQQKQLRKEYGIRGYPHVMLFSGGEAVRDWLGLREAEEYRQALDAVLSEAPQAPTAPAGEAS